MLMVEDGENNFKMVKRTIKRKSNNTMGRQVFGPVSTINSAPVAIGNSLKGAKPIVMQTKDGVRVCGRDFAFAAVGTSASITGWELIGGMPITPAVLASSTLRNFNQIYNLFKFNRIHVHYITSSPTSQAGDVLFYIEKNRLDPNVDYSNNSFLNYVMSDVQTVIGPQWANHTATVVPKNEFKSTSFGATIDADDDNQGTIYMFSKTNAVNSPGYILIDYDVTFRELSINPRAGIFPVVRGLLNQICFDKTSTTVVGVTEMSSFGSVTGKLLDGTTTSQNPSGLLSGDIYKCSLCATASTLVNTWSAGGYTLSNLFLSADAVDTAMTVDDGFTFYAKYSDTNRDGSSTPVWSFYPSASNAISSTKAYRYGSDQTAKAAYLNCWISLISSTAPGQTQNVY